MMYCSLSRSGQGKREIAVGGDDPPEVGVEGLPPPLLDPAGGLVEDPPCAELAETVSGGVAGSKVTILALTNPPLEGLT